MNALRPVWWTLDMVCTIWAEFGYLALSLVGILILVVILVNFGRSRSQMTKIVRIFVVAVVDWLKC